MLNKWENIGTDSGKEASASLAVMLKLILKFLLARPLPFNASWQGVKEDGGDSRHQYSRGILGLSLATQQVCEYCWFA